MMQAHRRMMTSLLVRSSRSTHTNPLGPSRGEQPPPWAAEKLINLGYSKEEIRSNWKMLLNKPDKNTAHLGSFLRFIRRDFDISPAGIKAMMAERKHRIFREDQIYRSELEYGVGPDIAAAKFLLKRSAAVRFVNSEHWFVGHEKLRRLPGTIHPSFMIEAIDLRSFQIIHRGFESFAKCKQLKALKMVNQRYVDDFCLDAISGMFSLSLQYLDISGCELVTERGLSCLHRCKRLKLLNVYNLPKVKHPELLVLLLEETLPAVEIRGIDYIKDSGKS